MSNIVVVSGVFLLEQNGVPWGGGVMEFGRCTVDLPFQADVAVLTVIHHYVTATDDHNNYLKETFLAEELANVDILTQQKILCVEGNP